MRKLSCCGFAVCYTALLEVATLGLYLPCCVLPRVLGGAFKLGCGTLATVAMMIGAVLAGGFVLAGHACGHAGTPLLAARRLYLPSATFCASVLQSS